MKNKIGAVGKIFDSQFYRKIGVFENLSKNKEPPQWISRNAFECSTKKNYEEDTELNWISLSLDDFSNLRENPWRRLQQDEQISENLQVNVEFPLHSPTSWANLQFYHIVWCMLIPIED